MKLRRLRVTRITNGKLEKFRLNVSRCAIRDVEPRPLNMISSPYCAVAGFVFIFVLNSLIRYTSVIAYMMFLSPPLRVVTFDELCWFEITSRLFYSLIVIIVWQGYLALIMKKNVSLSWL